MMYIFFQLLNVLHLRVTFLMAMKRMFLFYLLHEKHCYLYIYLCSWTHTDQAYCKYAFVLCAERQNPDAQIHPSPGSSFVDIGLKVVVRQATGTMTAFQPEYLHGTTVAHGAVNSSMIISFSRRITDAWEDAKKLHGKVQVVPGDGVVEET